MKTYSVKIYESEQKVKFGNNHSMEGIIVGALVRRPDAIVYEIAYWHNNERRTDFLFPTEFIPADVPKKLQILGFNHEKFKPAEPVKNLKIIKSKDLKPDKDLKK